jgi:hypothetical protein
MTEKDTEHEQAYLYTPLLLLLLLLLLMVLPIEDPYLSDIPCIPMVNLLYLSLAKQLEPSPEEYLTELKVTRLKFYSF